MTKLPKAPIGLALKSYMNITNKSYVEHKCKVTNLFSILPVLTLRETILTQLIW